MPDSAADNDPITAADSVLPILLSDTTLPAESIDPFRPRERVAWRGATIENRLQYFSSENFVPYPEFVKVVTAIRILERRCIRENKGTIMFVQIPSGGGKTTLVRFFKALKPTRVEDEATRVPVVAFSVPNVVTINRMEIHAFQALGHIKPKKAYIVDSDESPLVRAYRIAETEIVMIDNVQDVSEKRRDGGIRQIASHFRDTCDESRRLLVLLGTKDAIPVIDADPQISRRSAARKSMCYFDVRSSDGLSRFARFLAEIDKRLPLAEESDLANLEFVHPISYATGGIQEYVFRLIGGAIEVAFSRRREHLELADFAVSFDRMYQDQGIGMNPFRKEVSRIIDDPGEPLHVLLGKANRDH